MLQINNSDFCMLYWSFLKNRINLYTLYLKMTLACMSSVWLKVRSPFWGREAYFYYFLVRSIQVKWSEVTQWCPTLCDPMNYSLPCSSVHVLFQARVLEWVAISFSRGSSLPRDRTRVSRVVGRRFTIWATRFSLIRVVGMEWTSQPGGA